MTALKGSARRRHDDMQKRGRATAERLRAKGLYYDAEVVAQLLRSNSALRVASSQAFARRKDGRP